MFPSIKNSQKQSESRDDREARRSLLQEETTRQHEREGKLAIRKQQLDEREEFLQREQRDDKARMDVAAINHLDLLNKGGARQNFHGISETSKLYDIPESTL